MAITVLSDDPFDVTATHRQVIATYTGPASYPTGGDPISIGDFKNLGRVDYMTRGHAIDAAGSIYHLTFVYSTSKFRWFSGSGGTEAPAGTNLSGFTARLLAWGK